MAIDRDDALRKAEKLLRQGRLDGAIAEYEHVVDAYPDDIATASALENCVWARRQGAAGRRAVHAPRRPLPQGRRPGQGGGQLPQGHQARSQPRGRAAAVGRGLGEQGQLGDAKTHLQAAIDKRKARGDQDGADTLAIRLAELDPTDFEARFQAAKIRVRTGKAVVADLMALAQELDARKRTSEAEELLEEVVKAIRAPPRWRCA